MVKNITVFACESQPIVLEGLEKVLAAAEDVKFVGSTLALAEAVEPLRELRPDIVLADQAAGLKALFQFVASLREISPQTQAVLWVSELAESECFRALQLGARGILKKTLPVDALLECLRAVAGGGVWIENAVSNHAVNGLNRRSTPRFTPREREIVHLVARGLKNRQIADTLKITPGTVKVHLMHIFEKSGVKDRFELAIHSRRLMGTETETETAAAGAAAGVTGDGAITPRR